MRDIKWMEHVDGLIRVFKKYCAKSLWMLNMVKRLDISNHHQLYVQPSINAHHLLLVFVHILTASSLCLCSCPPPCPPSPLHLSLSSSTLSSISLHLLLHVCPCPPCLVSLSLSFLPLSSLSFSSLSLSSLSPSSSTRNWKRLLILICWAAHPLTTTVIPPFPPLKNKKVTSARISLHFRPLPSFANISSIYDPILQPPLIFLLCVNISEPFFPCQMRLQMWFSTAECVCVTKNEPLFTNATCP